MKHNDLDLENWRELNINTDSLWIIPTRDKTGKHKNIYHGNFGKVLPLGFYCMDMIKRNFKAKLKGTIIKNIEGNRGKLGTGGIWRYRALTNDYYIFKHEYFCFKKEF